MGGKSSTIVYGFFAAPTDLLGGLTPIEVLIGRLTTARDLDAEIHGLLATAAEGRLQAVIKAAEAQAA